MTPPSLDISTETARELAVSLLGFLQVSCLLDALPRLEQVRRQVGAAQVDVEAFDQAGPLDDGAAGLPEHAPLAWTDLDSPFGRKPDRAGLGIYLAHVPSVRSNRRQRHPAEH